MSFEYLYFRNITFVTKGYLLFLDQMLTNNLTISHSNFENIHQGVIEISSQNSENLNIFTSVNFENITVREVYQSEKSAIVVEQEAKVYITNSEFTS